MYWGEDVQNALKSTHVAVFGLGGVGGYAADALARAGVGELTLVDFDEVSITNINRQIHSTINTVGQAKVEVMRDRVLSINPKINVKVFKEFYMPDNSDFMIDKNYSYIVDAVDTVTAKIDLVLKATLNNIPIISAMGAANKLDPTKFEVTDIFKTSVCPLARVMRKELKSRGVKKLKVVYSKEEPTKLFENIDDLEINDKNKIIPASISFVPSVMGLIIAGEVIKDIIRG